MVYGNGNCEVFRAQGWWFVVSEVDWLAGIEPFDEVEAFFRVIHAPEIGVNTMRSEILLNAFASSVWIVAPLEYKKINGEDSQIETIRNLIVQRNLRTNWKRIVAFTADE